MLKAIIAATILLQTACMGQTKATVGDIEFAYPNSLRLFPIVPDSATPGPFILTNFDGKYGHGGFIPENGVEITILVLDKNGQSLADIVGEGVANSRLISVSPTRIGGQPATRVVCEDDFQVFKLEEIRVFMERGPQVYKFFLATYPEASNRKSFEASFDTLLSTVKFVK